MELRGSVNDRPWGLTLGAIALRRHTGQLTIEADGKRYCIAFEDGAIIAATSPMAADAIARVALTNHFITSTQVPDITRRLAAAPDRDEIDILAENIPFSPEQVMRLRHRVVAQRAARTFSLERGDFLLEDRITLPVVPGVVVDHRHVIYLGVRTNVSEQRLIGDLRQLGSFFVLKPEAHDEIPRFGFDASAEPVLDALRVGTSLPELEASNRDIDPRSAQAIIYALVSCTACVIPARTAAAPAHAPATGRRITQPLTSAARTGTGSGEPATSRTSTERDPEASRTATPPERPALDPAPGALPSFATGMVTFHNQSPQPQNMPPAIARSATPPVTARSATPPATARTTSSPFASRTSTVSPTAYAARAVPDAGTNTPAAIRPRAQSDAGSARSAPTTSAPAAARAATRSAAPRSPTTRSPLSPPAEALASARTDTDEAVNFTETPTPTPGPGPRAMTGEAPRGTRPTVGRVTTSGDTDAVRGFAEQHTPGFGDQRTPADQRTPGFGGLLRDHRTPTDPAFPNLATGTPTGAPLTGRVSTDNAAAAEAAFKRGDAAMKRDQPGDAILEFKAACDLNPSDVDYAAMLAWAKFCAAGDKPGIGADTRKALERAVFKSHRPERARFYLGRVERMLGRDKEALRHFQEVLEIKPNHADAASEIRAIEARLQAASKGGGLFRRR